MAPLTGGTTSPLFKHHPPRPPPPGRPCRVPGAFLCGRLFLRTKELTMSRRLTGFTPSGHLHLGNYIGAVRPIVAEQAHADTIVFVSDLHALTLDHDPAHVRARTSEFVTLYGEASRMIQFREKPS